MTSCICHGLGICTLTNPSVGDVIYFAQYAYVRYSLSIICSWVVCQGLSSLLMIRINLCMFIFYSVLVHTSTVNVFLVINIAAVLFICSSVATQAEYSC